PWTYTNNHFDFVHIRGLFGSIKDWPALYAEAFTYVFHSPTPPLQSLKDPTPKLTPGTRRSHLRAGGYLEQVEWSVRNRSDDGSLLAGSALDRWSNFAIEAGVRMGKSFSIAEDMPALIARAGFVDVAVKKYKWPVGPWSSDAKLKELGRWNLRNWEEGMEGWALALYTRVLGWSYDEVMRWLKEVRAALRDRNQHVYHEV
ncbi:hypothetical protein LTR28_010930, partial [Elasticomyces elasticus]